jgi:hypothetical protein
MRERILFFDLQTVTSYPIKAKIGFYYTLTLILKCYFLLLHFKTHYYETTRIKNWQFF